MTSEYHAIFNYLYQSGGKPVFMMPAVDLEQDEVQVLIKSIAAEESAVKKYTMIQQIIPAPEHKQLIGETIQVEEAHRARLVEILDEVKKLYREKKGGS